MDFRIVLPESRPEDDNEALVKLQQDLLNWAEEIFGDRDTGLILPPMFDFVMKPHIFYPNRGSLKRCNDKTGRWRA